MNRHDMHLLVATSLSMITSCALHCALEDTRATNSLFQETIIDPTCDLSAVIHCSLNNGQMKKKCKKLLGSDYRKTDDSIIIVLCCIIPLLYHYRQRVKHYAELVMLTVATVWVLGRFCNGFSLCCQIDTLTVYLIVWQCMFLISKWQSHEFPVFSLTLERGSFCLLSVLQAFVIHEIYLRHLPIVFRFALLWLLSVEDIVACLHPHGRLRTWLLTMSDFPPLDPAMIPCHVYYTRDLEEGDQLSENDDIGILGFGDFGYYNIMLLFLLPPFVSITTKVWIAFGYIIVVQIGIMTTKFIADLWNESVAIPCLPVPVVAASIYAIFLDAFVQKLTYRLC